MAIAYCHLVKNATSTRAHLHGQVIVQCDALTPHAGMQPLTWQERPRKGPACRTMTCATIRCDSRRSQQPIVCQRASRTCQHMCSQAIKFSTQAKRLPQLNHCRGGQLRKRLCTEGMIPAPASPSPERCHDCATEPHQHALMQATHSNPADEMLYICT